MPHYTLGIDFGTGSVRALLVDVRTGAEIAVAERGLETLQSAGNPELARQRPGEYLVALAEVIAAVLERAAAVATNFSARQVLALGVDATGSTPLPVDRYNRALGCLPQFENNLNAQAWLWKDHTASVEAVAITAAASERPEAFLSRCGGAYSAEWLWAKIWHCLRCDREVFNAAHSWVECCDWIASQLAGIGTPEAIVRSTCAAGHKALWSESWGGLPAADFLDGLDPELARLRPRLFQQTFAIGQPAGHLSQQWAARTGLESGIPVSVANLDAHSGAVGAGVSANKLVKIMGTSTCDCALLPIDASPDIAGISGVAANSIVPGYYGVEAGQSAVGDIFSWYVEKICQGDVDHHRQLSEQMSQLRAGESGLLALDWHNGNRCVLADTQLSGHLFGLTLHSTSAEIYRAWIEATAFGARIILDQLTASGITTESIVCCGGIATKNPIIMQIYADITGRALHVTQSDQTCALGAAIAAAVAVGAYPDVGSAQNAMASSVGASYQPDANQASVYNKIYRIYRGVHDAVGLGAAQDMRSMLGELRRISREGPGVGGTAKDRQGPLQKAGKDSTCL